MCVVSVCEICSARSNSSGHGGIGDGGGMGWGCGGLLARAVCAWVWRLTWLSRSLSTGSPCCSAVKGSSCLRMVVKWAPSVDGSGGWWLLLLASFCVVAWSVSRLVGGLD